MIAERAGIDRALAYEVLAASAAGAPYVEYKRAAFLDPEGTPPVFTIELAAKDLDLITGFADRLDVPVPQARTNLDVLRDALADGHAGADFAAVAVHLREEGRARANDRVTRSSFTRRPSGFQHDGSEKGAQS